MSDPVTAPLCPRCYLLPLSEVMLISGFGEMHEGQGGKVTTQRPLSLLLLLICPHYTTQILQLDG